jgi:DNA ligase-1
MWFDSDEVWEIRGADLTISPVHMTGIHHMGDRGIALRFPRFLRVRDDKSVEDATSAEQVVEMYNKQMLVHRDNKQMLVHRDEDQEVRGEEASGNEEDE